MIHRTDVGGLPAARNVLLQSSTADIVCFLDDDVDVARDFGTILMRLATSEPMMSGWGPVVETRGRWKRRLHRLAQMGAMHDPRRLLARRCDRSTSALFGCCFAVRRLAAIETGFDARRGGYALGEDLDFFLRLRQPLRFVTALTAIHRRDGHDRSDADARGRQKARFLLWLARAHGGRNPATPLHLGLALMAAASGRGDEPASTRAVLAAIVRRPHGRMT
ncbi:MAG: glycosyltransferase [Planctomycetes bacterium]|nr:glycosyltransferase [Planctomycetota bacterium]